MAVTFHTIGVLVAYAILIFFSLATVGDYRSFMRKELSEPRDWIDKALTDGGALALTLLFAWAIWMVSGVGCS